MKFVLPDLESLTDEQRRLVEFALPAGERKNLVVKGYGGTGKTIVACHRVLRLRQEGKKVLFLCFGKLLKKFISPGGNFMMQYLQAFYKKIRGELIERLKREPIFYKEGVFTLAKAFVVIDWWSTSCPYLIYKRRNETFRENVSDWVYLHEQNREILEVIFGWYNENFSDGQFLYDEIIIDEAQDVSPNVLSALKIFAPSFSIFADENQRIIWSEWEGATIHQIASIYLDGNESQIQELTCNLRTTKEISTYSAEFFLSEKEAIKLLEYSTYAKKDWESFPEEEFCPSREEQKKQLAVWLEESRKKGRNTSIFCGTKDEINDILDFLNEKGIEHGAYYGGLKKQWRVYTKVNDLSQSIFVSTYPSSKGLEADCVILLINQKDFDRFMTSKDGSKINNVLYVLTTRAKKKLYILFAFDEDWSLNNEDWMSEL